MLYNCTFFEIEKFKNTFVFIKNDKKQHEKSIWN